jgi:hypothetical protein
MLVFLSWSGDRSKSAALALEKWLSQVIQAVELWISTDIDKGLRWGPEITDRLERSRVGIIVLTPENRESPWILFEAGALSKTKDAYVCTLLIDLTHSAVEPPLSQFQHTTCDKADLLRLLKTINAAIDSVGERSLPESTLNDVFETNWPQLDEKLKTIAAEKPSNIPPARPQGEILDEILTSVRNLERKQARGSREILDRAMLRAITLDPDAWERSVCDLLPSDIERAKILYLVKLMSSGREEAKLKDPPPSSTEREETK